MLVKINFFKGRNPVGHFTQPFLAAILPTGESGVLHEIKQSIHLRILLGPLSSRRFYFPLKLEEIHLRENKI